MDNKTIIDTVLEASSAMNFDKVTMHELEALSLPKVTELTPKQIASMRRKEKVSQNVMAQYLNISSSTYQKWERGEVTPTGGNMKLLNLVYKGGLDSITF